MFELLTVREIAIATISGSAFFAVGFLIAAYTRIFAERTTSKGVNDVLEYDAIRRRK